MKGQDRVVVLKGKKISLVVPEKEDILLWYKGTNNLDITFLLGKSENVKSLESLEKRYEDIFNDDSIIRFSILDNGTKKIVGYVDLKSISHLHGRAEIGIVILDFSMQGKGFGTETMRLIGDYAFRIQGLRKIRLQHVSDNIAGNKVYEKVGFKIIGERKKDALVNGNYVDKTIREIFKEEFYKVNKEYFE